MAMGLDLTYQGWAQVQDYPAQMVLWDLMVRYLEGPSVVLILLGRLQEWFADLVRHQVQDILQTV